MTTEIRQSDLRNDNAVIMRRVAAGESFVVTVNGRAVADVVPHQRDTGRRAFVPAADALDALAYTPLSRDDARRWLADIRQDDDTPRDPWARQSTGA
ncbi:type II toxin-antitoxin system Phd/YefM family antitoxin [Serinicoccus marinus]|uniref:type II toxin-antitoxin system Phd/YefM family antitoxin n=1 Tax=Serinicoccus marinus TaxID=247333 RepID=UPI0003B5C28E|nr:type II toxin-antitoxin system prevent-host-death family antitoxin [Serinicoccus marinus]